MKECRLSKRSGTKISQTTLRVVREMGISPQLTQDFNSTQNDKDLIETPKVQDFNSNKKFPDYASFKKECIFLLGIDESFSYLNKDLDFIDVENGRLKKKEADGLIKYIFK